MLCLVAVSSAEINGSYSQQGEMGAHMHAALMPKAAMQRWWPEMASAGVQASAQLGDTPEALRASERDSFIVLEGTGILDPSGRGEAEGLTSVRAQFARRAPQAFDDLRRVYTYARPPTTAARGTNDDDADPYQSAFYKILSKMFTGEFELRNCGVAAFVPSPGAAVAAGAPSYGVRFSDVVVTPTISNARVRLVAEPALTPAQRRFIRAETRDLHPLPSLTLASNDVDAGADTGALTVVAQAHAQLTGLSRNNMRAMQARLQRQVAPLLSSAKALQQQQLFELRWHWDYEQAADAQRCTQFAQAFANVALERAECLEEPAALGMGGYMVRIVVAASKQQ